jgi:hypothetical protein
MRWCAHFGVKYKERKKRDEQIEKKEVNMNYVGKNKKENKK